MNKISNDEENNYSDEKNPFSFKKFMNDQSPVDFFEAPIDKPKKNSILIDDNNDTRNESNPLSFKVFTKKDNKVHTQISCELSFSPDKKTLPSPPDFNSITNTELKNNLPTVFKKYESNNSEKENGNNVISSIFDQNTNSCYKVTADINQEFKTLQELKKNINLKQKIIYDRDERILQLEKKIDQLKQNEANENKALEVIIQQVEENLVKTTKRAVEAERNVDKMKSEIEQFKFKIQILNTENQNLKLTSPSTTETNSLNNIADQLNGAADSAENSLNQLMTGCKTLRLLAATLESLEKIKEVSNPK